MCSQAAANPVAQSQDRVGHRQVPVDDVIKLHRHLHREGPPRAPELEHQEDHRHKPARVIEGHR